MSDLSCAELVELVTDFLEGTLDHDTEGRFVEHLGWCDGCGPYLEQIRQTVNALGELPDETVSSEVRDALLDAFRQQRGSG
ncbi:MAG: zf-HC2 domain-containing protein [Kibdelosporangium sp.]